MYYVEKKLEISASHSLKLDYPSKCSRLHGHNWQVTICCRARELNANGMVCDFSDIKERIHGYLDHGNLNELLPFNPTAENIARWCVEQIPHLLQGHSARKRGQHGDVCQGRRSRFVS